MTESSPSYTLAELAERFQLEVVGDGQTRVAGLCELKPGEPGKLGFLASPQYRAQLADTRAAAVVVGKRDVSALTTPGLLARDPSLAFARIARLFDASRAFAPGVDASASVAGSARLATGVFVGARAVIEAGVSVGEGSYIGPGSILRADASLGPGCRLEAAVTVGERVRLGARVLVQPGAVIGARGFGNVRLPDGSWEEMPQLGTVVVGDDVEIGANTTIDRGALGDTVIEDGVRLDNQIQIAHNCVIGRNTAIAACTGIAGSTRIGQRCMIGGAAGIGGHLVIADDVVLLGRAMVTNSIDTPGVYGSGLPLAPAREWRKTVARVRRLDKLTERVKHLEGLLHVKAQESADASEGNDN
ncbi:UDP-3-O-(3-hydroxymyristoyl)glucosamine N-acyltransferase [Stagnimonas aquatica]|uniref:UDP-3-O-acylglucosamine N-acyltransferase n=1 Tax=Stagnimonas aquatica TaxID=2689987 RepID=A0A3N0VEG9_9GAMM|nr:UDP-3-O-(3-hydroxymyristoyl)glucosamine N-acyltransferase [Stagnimonas aquatica]ROH91116.1 UDP-3-O-(3-hydroxymyristoyl)glucosamine N-acyltransferase [Stagnimonas aquatica]